METRRVRLANGVEIPYLDHGVGTPVILLHSIADSLRLFEPMLAHLPATIRAVVPSQRGHGDASRPEEGYRPEDFAGDLDLFMEALGIERAVIVGGSSGGVIARRFAIDHPERTLALVMLGSPFALGEKAAIDEMWESTFSKLDDPIDPEMVRDFAETTLGRLVPPELVEIVIEENLKAPAHVWTATMAGLMEDRSHRELGAIDAPTLLLWGEDDAILSREDQESMLAAIPGARLIRFPGLGHAFYLEDPERVAGAFAAFVESLG
ncbi:MAG: alpha/beta fold hydrolase [Actinomycetota bacterium]